MANRKDQKKYRWRVCLEKKIPLRRLLGVKYTMETQCFNVMAKTRADAIAIVKRRGNTGVVVSADKE